MSYHGGDAAQSGSISDNGQSWMQTMVSGPGIIRLYWKVSSQLGGDYMEFFIDGVRQARISGTTDWQGQSYTITGAIPPMTAAISCTSTTPQIS